MIPESASSLPVYVLARNRYSFALAVTARLIQGFALGGEVGSASIYMLESARTGSRGFTMSWQAASQSIAGATGALVGLGLSLILNEAQLAAFGWRIALGVGAVIVPLAALSKPIA